MVAARFPTTRRSVVLALGSSDAAERARAFDTLVAIYWKPLYKYAPVEDGPTLTHGGMRYGAGVVAARQAGAAEIIDPSPFAVGSIRATYDKYPNAAGILPAMGYGSDQIRELQETIRRTPADVVVIGTPIDLTRVFDLDRPSVRVRYELRELVPGRIEQAVIAALAAVRENALVTSR